MWEGSPCCHLGVFSGTTPKGAVSPAFAGASRFPSAARHTARRCRTTRFGTQRSIQIEEHLHLRMERRDLRRVCERDSHTTSVTRHRPDEPKRQLVGFTRTVEVGAQKKRLSASFRSCGCNPGGSTIGWLQRWIAAALRRRSGFP